MGTQTSVLFCCLTVLSRRLKIGAVQTVFESSLIDECQHGRVFVTIFIIPADDHFFNYAFKNITVKSVQHFVFFQRPTNVYKYKDTFYNRPFILKRAKKELTDKEVARFKREFDVMNDLSSPYILEVYCYNPDKNEYIMEYIEPG